MAVTTVEVRRILEDASTKYRGPGGAVAVLLKGQLIDTHVWGYADMDRRIPMTLDTLIPICSITKQFVSLLLYELRKNPPASLSSGISEKPGGLNDLLSQRLREILPPAFVDKDGLTVDNLIDMASGLRDYWAVCTVQGSRPESPYSLEQDNPEMLRRIQSLHFAPGTEYSYCNTNFNVVERLIEHAARQPLEKLLSERVWGPAKMTTTRLCQRTDRLPPPIVGYEGTEKTGFTPAPNFIEWSADAGMVASLRDMIAYEKYFDTKYINHTDTGFRDTISPRMYKGHSNTIASYRHGLRHYVLSGYNLISHGGALRGYRLNRCYVQSERLSVVVLFNHTADSVEATEYIIKRILKVPEPANPIPAIVPDQSWFGAFLDQDTQLSIRIVPGGIDAAKSKIKITYSRTEESLTLINATNAKSGDSMTARIEGDTVHVHRIEENRNLVARRLASKMITPSASLVGHKFWCAETESTFKCEGQGEMLYGLFDGCFGKGPPHLMTHIGEDVWVLADPRAMDATAPGDWTLVFACDETGAVVKVTIGCWLARKLEFLKV